MTFMAVQRLLVISNLVTMLLLNSTISLASQHYWVAPDAKSCSQAPCVCTEQSPCALDNRLFMQLQPGNTVQLAGGNYPGFVISNLHGSKEAPIRFRGPTEGAPAQIRGAAPNNRDAIEVRTSTHLILEHLHISEAPRAGIRLNNSHHIAVHNSTIEKSGVWGIFTNHANHFNATSNTIIGPAEQHGIYQSNSGDHVQIIGNYIINFDGCAVHFNGDLSMGGAAGVEGDGIISDIVIRDNFFAGNGRVGGSAINLDGVDGGLIENNILFDNKATGIAVFKHDGAYGTRNMTIERNLVIMPPGARFAINFNHSEGNNLLRHNILIAQDHNRGIYDVRPVEISFNRSEPIAGLPFRASNNSYVYQGLFAMFNSRRRLTLQQWQQQGQDQGSTILQLNHMLLPETEDYQFTVPALLAKQMEQYQIAKEHPYRHLLVSSNDSN